MTTNTTITITTTITRILTDVKRAFAAAALLAIAAGSFQPFYLKVLRQDWRQLGAYLTELPYRKAPGLRELCVETGKRTPPGATVMLVAPVNGYEYSFRRAQYLLAGRDVIPMGRAAAPPAFIACAGNCPAPPGFVSVWRSDRGMLLKKR
jgi:hypothetical protein